MPSSWTPKQERQYKHIKVSCVKRKCRRVRGKTACVRTCTRIAAATTNKFRAQSRGLSGSGIRRQIKQINPMIEGWRREGFVDGREGAAPLVKRTHGHTLRWYNGNLVSAPRRREAWAYLEGFYRGEYERTGRKRGFGSVKGKCCILRGKTRVACFHERKDAFFAMKAMKRSRSLRLKCV